VDSLNQVKGDTSNSDAWAVGNGSGFASLIEHWDGKRWKAVPSPTTGTGVNIYTSVTATSVHNVWAVGYYFDSNGIIKTFIAHWSGTMWRIVFSPNPGSRENLLSGLSGTSDENVWAVGLYLDGSGLSRMLIEFSSERDH